MKTQFQSPFSHLFKDTKNLETSDGISIRYVGLKTHAENPRGTVLLLSGWTEFIEKYGEPISKILERGFNVFTLDWRGQGLSSRSLPNSEKGYIRNYQEFLDDLNEFVSRIILPEGTGPFIMMAHSMGGNIGIQYLHDYPDVFNRAVFCCPMFDLPVSPLLKSTFRLLSSTAITTGLGGKYVIGRGDWVETPFAENQVTSDPERYAHDVALLKQNPQLKLGAPTYTWLNASLKAIKRVNNESFLKDLRIPAILFSATKDQVVSITAHEFAAKHMPRCELIPIHDGRHELLRETDEIQQTLWNHFDRFLQDL
jgi:lysophospholipase